MPAATILIPTHNHVAPLRHAIAGAQSQTFQDFELFVVGDGVGDATRDVMRELGAADRRIRFFDFPKGPRKGEIHRHEALKQATGRIVAYLGDDDAWMPEHLETLDRLLWEVDFGHTLHIGIDEEGALRFLPADLENPDFRRLMLTQLFNRFDLTFAGHTLEAYRKLPYGWRTTPPAFPWTDLYMWRQFLAEPWCRARSAMAPTCICTASSARPNLTDQERADELAVWRDRFEQPGFREAIWRQAADALAREAVREELDTLTLKRTAAKSARLLKAGLARRLGGPGPAKGPGRT
jgi:glycosyltransferase involved in cell wall biosynthesis